MHIIVVSAHPDDMEIGMGGTVAKLVSEGCSVTEIVLTDGRRSPNPFGWSEEKIVATRKREAVDAASILGVKDVVFFDMPDLRARSNYENARDRLGSAISEIQPTELYTHHPELDRHPTHQLAGRITLEAFVSHAPRLKSTVWAYEIWGLFPSWDRLGYIDAHVATKMRAINAHQSQIASIPYEEGIIGLNRWRGAFADPHQRSSPAKYAEAFVRLLSNSDR